MTTRMLVFLVSFVMLAPAWGVRRVGFGGGEAEQRLLEMSPYVKAWVRACVEDTGMCSSPLTQAMKTLGVSENPVLDFVSGLAETPSCADGKVIFPHELLYIDNDTRKEDRALAALLLEGVLICSGQHGVKLSTADIDVLPLGQQLLANTVYVLRTQASDVLVGLQTDQHLDLQFKIQTQCLRYRLVGAGSGTWIVQCKDQPWRFTVRFQVNEKGALEMRTRYLAD